MKRLLLSVGLIALATSAGASSVIPIGSSVTLTYQNGPGTCSDTTCTGTTTLGSSTTLDGGLVSFLTGQVPQGPNAEWDTFSIAASPSIVGDVNGDWSVKLNFDIAKPAVFDEVSERFFRGTTQVAVSNFGGICCATNDALFFGGPGYSNSGFSVPVTVGEFNTTTFNQIFIDPWSFGTSGGLGTDDITRFDFAIHFTQTSSAIPEAKTWVMGLIGFGLMGLIGAIKTRRRALAPASS